MQTNWRLNLQTQHAGENNRGEYFKFQTNGHKFHLREHSDVPFTQKNCVTQRTRKNVSPTFNFVLVELTTS